MENHIAVGAIDFGTTFSGWAISFRQEYEKEPAKVFAKNWNSGQNISSKTPTALLIHPDGKTLAAFGYDAENEYVNLAGENKHKNYYYFRRFKMMLYKQKFLTKDTKLEDDNGRSLSALLVFSLAIGYLKDDLLTTCSKSITEGIVTTEILWVLTVPAIWNEQAKKFMRQAAIMAGIPSDHLLIALEPEAASIYCNHLPMEKVSGDQLASFTTGMKYMVVDCGGGTVDITCHEVLAGKCLKEIHRASGNYLGGTAVDDSFLHLMCKVFGDAVMKQFKTDHCEDYQDLLRGFEVKKRDISPTAENMLTLSLPFALVALYNRKTGGSIYTTFENNPFGDDIILIKGNKLRIAQRYARKHLYEKVLDNLLSLLQKIVIEIPNGDKELKAVLLVGGFSESKMIQECVRTTLPDKQLLVPEEAVLSVLKGAVVYGHNTAAIKERVCRYTYGEDEFVSYVEKLHGKAKIYKRGGKMFVEVFKPIVFAGDIINHGEAFNGEQTGPVSNDQNFINFPLFAMEDDQSSDAQGLVYTDDPRCTKLGTFKAPITDKDLPLKFRKFDVQYIFGGTEVSALVTELSTGKTTTGTFNFLG